MVRRRPGPISEEYWGCTRDCWDLGRHTEKGGCEKYTPPCEHPVESICIDSDGSQVVCGECREGMTVSTLVESARPGLSISRCICTDACVLHCPPPLVTSWTLDPAKVLKVYELSRSLDD